MSPASIIPISSVSSSPPCPRLQVLDNDFFLVAAKEAFMDAARTFLFETYCRVHQQIDLAELAGQLGMDREATEKWIVNLIRYGEGGGKVGERGEGEGGVCLAGHAMGAWVATTGPCSLGPGLFHSVQRQWSSSQPDKIHHPPPQPGTRG